MPQITKYVLVLITFIAIHETSLASNEATCKNILPQYEITYTESPIDYNLNKRARDLLQEFNANEYTLGYFHSNLNIEKQSTFTTLNVNNKDDSCKSLTKLEINLSFHPTIFITKEAQSFKCTFDRTIKHEHNHYKIEKNAFLKLLQNIDQIVKKHFDSFNTMPNLNKEKEMDFRISNLLKDINLFLENETTKFHAFMDTEENYYEEAKVCDEEENLMLDRLFELEQ